MCRSIDYIHTPDPPDVPEEAFILPHFVPVSGGGSGVFGHDYGGSNRETWRFTCNGWSLLGEHLTVQPGGKVRTRNNGGIQRVACCVPVQQ